MSAPRTFADVIPAARLAAGLDPEPSPVVLAQVARIIRQEVRRAAA